MSSSPSNNVFVFNKTAIFFFALIAVGVAGIAHYHFNRPRLEATPATPAITLPGQLAVTLPAQGEAAIGTDRFGVIRSTQDQTAIPIASVTKIMTAYLVLQAHPLKPGEEGPTLTMTAQDVADYTKDLAQDDSVLKIKEGDTLTEKQLLEGLLLPSGDNIASTLARWVSGSEPAFVAKMNETAQSLGMTKTHYEEASGVSPATVSNATDQMKIAQMAMQDPVFREIVAMPQATFHTAGTVYNVNSLLGSHGIVGIKTGSSLPAGGCFVSAVPIKAGSETHYLIGVVLGQKSDQPLHSALQESTRMLDEVRPQFKAYPLTPPPDGIGQLTAAWQGNNNALNSVQPIQIFGYPGMSAKLSIDLLKLQVPLPAGDTAASLKVQAGDFIQEFPLVNAQAVNPPGVLWRIFRNWF